MTANSLNKDVLTEIYRQGGLAIREVERPDGGKDIVVPEGYETHHIPALDPKLVRIKQSATFYDIGSFIEYVKTYKSESARIFSVPGHMTTSKQASFRAILDYHKGATQPDHGVHIATYAPRYSEPWQRWMAVAGRPMKQADFGEFIEENRQDIAQPLAADLLDIVNKFKATKKVDFNSVTNAPNGDIVVGYAEQTEVQGSRAGVQMPPMLKLGIPVYFRGAVYEVTMLMRYRVGEGALTFVVKPDRVEYIEQDAFDELTSLIADQTEIRPYLGVAA